ncbi:unnamed protein product [Caenorhabditis nigoni]
MNRRAQEPGGGEELSHSDTEVESDEDNVQNEQRARADEQVHANVQLLMNAEYARGFEDARQLHIAEQAQQNAQHLQLLNQERRQFLIEQRDRAAEEGRRKLDEKAHQDAMVHQAQAVAEDLRRQLNEQVRENALIRELLNEERARAAEEELRRQEAEQAQREAQTQKLENEECIRAGELFHKTRLAAQISQILERLPPARLAAFQMGQTDMFEEVEQTLQTHRAAENHQAQQFHESWRQVVRAEIDNIIQLTQNELLAKITQPAVQGSHPIQQALKDLQVRFAQFTHNWQSRRTPHFMPDEDELIVRASVKTRRNQTLQMLPHTSQSIIQVQQAVFENAIKEFQNRILALIAQQAARTPQPTQQFLRDLHAQISKTYQAHTAGCANRAQQALQAHAQEYQSAQYFEPLEKMASQYERMTQYTQKYLAILEDKLKQQSEHPQKVAPAQEADRVGAQGPRSTIATGNSVHVAPDDAQNGDHSCQQ